MKQIIAIIAAVAFIASTGTAISGDACCKDKAKSEHKCSDACKDKCQGEKKDK